MTGASASLAVTGCRLFDGVGRIVAEPATVQLAGDRVLYAGPARDAPPHGPQAHVVEAAGLTAMPGLIDLHTRSDGLAEMATYLQGGVTSVRFAGLDLPSVQRVRAAVAPAAHAAPRILSCGPLLDAAPASWPGWTALLESPAQAREVAATLAADPGVDALMVAQNVDAASLAQIVEVAHAHGLPVTGQVWALDGAAAARAGIDQLDNTSRLLASSLWPRRGPGSFTRVTDRIECWARGWSSVDWDATMRIVDAMVEHGVAHCPTLTAHYWWTDLRRHELERDPLFQTVSPDAPLTRNQQVLREVEQAWTRELKMVMRAALSNREEWLRRFHGAGGRIVVGTDTRFGGVMIHSELRYLADAGVPAATVARAATSAAADAAGRPDIGRLTTGARADLLLVDGDPTVDVSAARRIRAIVRGGELVSHAPLSPAPASLAGGHLRTAPSG